MYTRGSLSMALLSYSGIIMRSSLFPTFTDRLKKNKHDVDMLNFKFVFSFVLYNSPVLLVMAIYAFHP